MFLLISPPSVVKAQEEHQTVKIKFYPMKINETFIAHILQNPYYYTTKTEYC